MTVYGYYMTDKDKETGWADIKPTHHPVNPLIVLSLNAWKLADKMIEEGRDWETIHRLQTIAQEIEDMA